MKIILKDNTEFMIDRLQANIRGEAGKGIFDDFMVTEDELQTKSPEEIAASFTDDNVGEVSFENSSGRKIKRKYTNVASIRYIFSDTSELLNIFLSGHHEEGGEIVEI